MDVALEHFAARGFHKTTISNIARHANISKGLMYNYFENKEALLHTIIQKSANEIYRYLDINRDGHLSEEEFEFFIKKLDILLKRKKHFWQLMLQLMMQNDVREQFLKALRKADALTSPGYENVEYFYPSLIRKMFIEYFHARKTENKPLPDPDCELEMFVNSLLGYAILAIYSKDNNIQHNTKFIDRIIELYK